MRLKNLAHFQQMANVCPSDKRFQRFMNLFLRQLGKNGVQGALFGIDIR